MDGGSIDAECNLLNSALDGEVRAVAALYRIYLADKYIFGQLRIPLFAEVKGNILFKPRDENLELGYYFGRQAIDGLHAVGDHEAAAEIEQTLENVSARIPLRQFSRIHEVVAEKMKSCSGAR
jgi:hypothetical protein